MKKKSKQDYKPVVYGVIAGVLIIVLFGVLYTSTQVGRVGVAFGALVSPTVKDVMDSVAADSTGITLVVPAEADADLIADVADFAGEFGISDAASKTSGEVSVTDANLLVFGTAMKDVNLNGINNELLPHWECGADKAVIKVDESGDGAKLLVIGKTKPDLDDALAVLENYQSYDLDAGCVKLFTDNSGVDQIIPCVFVTRSLPAMEINQQATVTLNVEVYGAGMSNFGFNEEFPAGWTFGTMTPSLVIGGVTDNVYAAFGGGLSQDTTFTYTITPTSSGTASFSGASKPVYGSIEESCVIFGDTQVTIGAECTTDADCIVTCVGQKSSPVSCVEGACVILPTGLPSCDKDCGAACETDADCGAGEVCNTETCACEPAPQCTVDADCNDTNVCTTDTCVAGSCVYTDIPDCCTEDADCFPGCTDLKTLIYACDEDNTCVYATTIAQCSIADCGASCETDANCAAGETCNTDTCACEGVVTTLADTFDEVTPATFKTVIGGEAPTEDNLASLDVNGKFRITTTVIDSTVADPLNENLIIIGGPCANTAAAAVMENPVDCTTGFTPGQGKLIVNENNGYKQIIVAGYSGMDTRVAARIVVDYENRNLNANSAATQGTLTNPSIVS